MLRGGNTTLREHNVTETYLYGLGTNCNNVGTWCNTQGDKCNGDIMNGDKTLTGLGHNVTGLGTQFQEGRNERGHTIIRPTQPVRWEVWLPHFLVDVSWFKACVRRWWWWCCVLKVRAGWQSCTTERARDGMRLTYSSAWPPCLFTASFRYEN